MNPITILLAEDNPVNQKVAELMFRRLGYSIDVVSDGQQAVDAVRDRGYDIVLMDAQMPVMDGVSAARWIRENLPENRQPMIFVMSASILSDSRHAWREVRVDGFIEKPVRVDFLRSEMERAVAEVRRVRVAQAEAVD
jgi:CheY-like chemotaxis protein